MNKLPIFFLLAAMVLPLAADEIAVREVGGVPVIRCKMFCNDKQIEAHILFDMGLNVPLVIHEKTVGGFALSPDQADGRPVDIEFSENVRWKGIPMRVQGLQMLESLTAKYAPELKEVPVVAIVGLPAIKNSVVELDMHKGLLKTLGMASEKAREKEFDYEAKSYGIVMDGVGPTGVKLKALLAMRSEASILDQALLHAARKAGEKPNSLTVGGLKLSDHAAFRFRPLDGAAPETIGAVIGVSALRNISVTIWPKRKKIAFIPQAETTFPQDEQDYFFALADKKPEGVEAFIAKRPRQRLLDEACLRLWQMRLEDPSTKTGTLTKVLETISENYESKRSAATLTSIADNLETVERADKEDLVMLALDLAMKKSGVALDQTAVHAVHVRFGRKAFTKGDHKQARRHLLSAAFGMPKNGECNFWLGEVYKEMGKPRRAWSRYFQSILDPRVPEEILADSLARLDELNRDPKFREDFNMVVAEQYMAGRLEDAEFHAPSRYSLARNKFPGHVKLVEFFTDANKPETGGMQLAFQALDEYFEGEVALIGYHLNDPMHSEVAADRLEYYKGVWAPLAVFDGKSPISWNSSEAKKLSDNAAENYPDFRDACLLEKAATPSPWTLAAELKQRGMKVSGKLTVAGEGETENLRVHAILCERSVMAIEGSGVFFHHFVARKALTPPDGLELERVLKEPFGFGLNATHMSKNLTKMLDGDGAAGGRTKPTYVDPNKLLLVVFVQHQEEQQVLAAESFALPQEDEVP